MARRESVHSNRGAVNGGNLLPGPTNIVPIREKKSLLNHISFHFLEEIQLHYNLIRPKSSMRSTADWNIVMQHLTVV